MKSRRTDSKERETARVKARELKHQKLNPPDCDALEGEEAEEEEGFVRVPAETPYVKRELYRVLNAFQNSPGFGVYVCEDFRDPRHQQVDSYFHEVESTAFGISALCRMIGPTDTPLGEHARFQILCFADALERLAGRARAACAKRE